MIRINDLKCKAAVKATAMVSAFLLLVVVASFGQQQINLTAAPTTATMPDGTIVPMWGYFCGTTVSGSTATCAAANPHAVAAPTAVWAASTAYTAGQVIVDSNGNVERVTVAGTSGTAAPTWPTSGTTTDGTVTWTFVSSLATYLSTTATWSPIVITVPTGTTATPASLQINLTNYLSFASGANNIPTSIVIVGQVGGGLGGAPTTSASPSHQFVQGCPTWFIADPSTPPGTPCTADDSGAVPPTQGPRIRSMGAEVAATLPTATTATVVPLTWGKLKPGTFLLESGSHPSIQVPMGLIGTLVVTTAPSGTTAGTAYPATATSVAVPYNAEVPVEFSEIDPVQNKEVTTAVNTAGFLETNVWSGMTGKCGNPSSAVGVLNTCYPPAVNYTPLYYLINGVAFTKTNALNSVFAATAGVSGTPPLPVITGITGTVLVRIVNAGSRMHTPSMVNSFTQGFNGAGGAATVGGFTLIAEDGNLLPNVAPLGATTIPAAPRVQTDVLMVPSKVYDALINVPIAVGTATPAVPIYARDLALSGNSSVRDAGMVAYISVNNSNLATGLPVAAGLGIFATAVARPDTYDSLAAGQPFSVSDPSKGVIANDTNVYGVTLLTAPTNGTLSCSVSVVGVSGVGSGAGICANGTFTYTPNNATTTSDTFTYCANGTVTGATCSSGLTATVTLGPSTLTGNPTAVAQAYTANTASFIKIDSPGLLLGNLDPNNLPISIKSTSLTPCTAYPVTGMCGTSDTKGGFTLAIASATAGSTQTFTYTVQNSLGVASTGTGTVTVTFPAPSNLKVNVLDAQAYKSCNGNASCISGLTPFPDYRWIIEEDKTFWVDPNCTTNSSITTAGCPSVVGGAGTTGSTVPTYGVNFHTSNMGFVAQGCTGVLSCEGGQTMLDTNPSSTTFGQHIAAVCDVGNGACRPDPTGGSGSTPVLPSQVVLDPSKRYYISVLPGDAANPFPSNVSPPSCNGKEAAAPAASNTGCGHTMSGAPIPPACNILGGTNACATSSAFTNPVNVLVLPTPIPTGRLSVIVFEDDYPLNGEQDGGGGNATVAPIEPGLGGFNLVLWDTFGGLGDVTGQDTYDVFNQPLSNGLAGTIDPTTGMDACPLTPAPLNGPPGAGTAAGSAAAPTSGMTGMIVTCPKYESDGQTLSPLAGQAIIYNLMPDKFSVQAYPGADRIARGEQWLQTNTLDGQHPHDSFIRIGEPSYFQEYGPAGYHVAIGFANPAIINGRTKDVCAGFGTPGAVGPCTNTIDGQVDVQRISRTPDQRLYPSGSRDAFSWTQCWVSLGDPDGEDFMFQMCDAQGNFKFTNVPGGNWRITIGDQWNDQIIDGLSTPANVGCLSNAPNGTINATTCPGGQTLHMGNIGVQQWQANLYTRVFIDDNKNGIWDPGEIGIPFLYTRIYYRDGSNANGLNTDFNGIANFNETYPLFNWYVVEADSTRYKTTGTHSVYDAGGPADGSTSCGNGTTARQCGTSGAYHYFSNTYEGVPLPADLSVPGAVYCAKADCAAEAAGFAAGTAKPSTGTAGLSTGRIDPPWVTSEGWAGLTGLSNWIDFGKAPYAACPPACVSATPVGVLSAVVTSGGTGYAVGDTISLTGGGGTGAIATVATISGTGTTGPVLTVTISSGGSGYATPPTVDTTSSGAGTGAILAATLATTASTVEYAENGGIHGQVTYASTRPFDDADQMILQPWEPLVPGVTINLYQEGFAADGVTPTLTLVDTTMSSSWDTWAQGFYPNYSDATSGTPLPYMNCPGQGTNATTSVNQDLFYFTLFDQPNYLDYYTKLHSVALGSTTFPAPTPLPYNSQYKCYDSMHMGNQIQPAPYNGEYYFPSSLGVSPTNGKPVTTQITATTSPIGKAASMAGTFCTVCVPNPDTTDVYRVGTPMLPPGKYVVEVVMPPGYEVYKEEDKNLLIGDNFIAPVTQQFGGLGADIFIVPDQASVASMYDESAAGFNPSNYQDQTTALGLGDELSGVPGYPGFQDPVWPCVGELRVVPDYLSLFPQAKEVAPFAGATRPLCDRKEVTLGNQMNVRMHFAIFTSTHIASKFTGGITDDFTSEFDPFAPQFGEKFGPPNLPVSTRDYLGNELSRVYADHWGTYDGLTFSSWEVNPPNITGYSPSMMVQCMNDPGPIKDTNPSSPTFGQLIPDPLYNSAYSDFCYEQPFMPGLTLYADTPVVPTEAFVGAAYNNPDCSYPDTTPAIAEVDGSGVGPWVSAAGQTLTITALGNQQVNNSAYSGPSASVAPFNQKTITRHYGFGTTQTTASAVTIGGVAATITGWSDSQIKVTVPAGVPNCAIQQQVQYGGPGAAGTSTVSLAQCGQLLITASNGKQSIDTVTVTIGGKPPTHVSASTTAPGVNSSVQAAIDAASPGDLIIVDPTCTGTCTTDGVNTTTGATSNALASHNEMLIMWKPVRLQGVGAASSIIDASAFPAGTLLDPWRRHINCFFGLSLSGVPAVGTGTGAAPVAYDSTKTYNCPDSSASDTWNYFTTPTNLSVPQIDRLPLEAVVGWDATVNGNLAEQLQEPSLMGAYEGAGITVLGKGVWTSAGENVWTDSSEGGAFPPDALLLQDVPINPDDEGAALGPQYSYCWTTTPTGSTTTELNPNPYPSNYECNPSSIDGVTVRDSSQGGGGIFVHGWAHNIQIANNRIYNNAGTLSGGISVGQGEFPIALTVVDQEGTSGAGAAIGEFVPDNPPSCLWIPVIGAHLPYCLDVHVNVHNNMITGNSSLGDELFSGTLSGGGGATFCTGSDYYKFQYNWVCGNLSSAEGGGVAHIGFIYDGDIEHNTIVLNQSDNPTIPTNGGGIQVMGTPDTDPICGAQIDQDCPPGLGDGTGPNLVINANLIQGNMAESGSGGGIRIQQLSGTDISTFPNNCVVQGAGALVSCSTAGSVPASNYWNNASITNNIIVNNVAGWDGGGISLQDSLNVIIRNNTISSNDTLASSGVLTQSIGTPEASAPAGSCVQVGPTGPTTASCPQSAGVTSTPNSSVLTTTFTGLTLTCPTGMPSCMGFSNPLLQNNLIWQNRSFQIGISGSGTGTQNQQDLVSLFNAFTASAAPVQTASGQCTPGVSYWDLGVRGDTAPNNHSSGYTLNPTYSFFDDPGDYASGHNLGANPGITNQYCNGSRVPPECTVTDGCGGPNGYGVPPGIVDASTPNPVFSLTPSATVDEGNNWINVSWGPLSLSNDATNTGVADGNYGGGPLFANYALASTSPAIDYVPVAQTHPSTDFFGNPRPDPSNLTKFDVGAIEFQGTGTGEVYVSPTVLLFTHVYGTAAAPTQILTVTNGTAATVAGLAVTVANTSTAVFSRGAGGCGATLLAGASCNITIAFAPPTATTNVTYTGTVTITRTGGTVVGSPVGLTGEGIVAVPAASVTPSSLPFGNQADGTTSAAQTLTVTNTGNVALAGGAFTFGGGTPEPFARAGILQGGPGSCAGGLALGASCTINVVFAPPIATTTTAYSRTLTVAYTTAGTTVTGSPVALTGTGTPVGTLSFTSATNGTLGTVLGVRTLTFTIPTPRAPVTSVVTITNTGGGTLQITAESLLVNIGGRYSITGTTCSFTTPLAPAGTCTVSIHYATPATRPTLPDVGAATFANNGSGTVGGVTGLALVAQ